MAHIYNYGRTLSDLYLVEGFIRSQRINATSQKSARSRSDQKAAETSTAGEAEEQPSGNCSSSRAVVTGGYNDFRKVMI
jgi:hypothetical protein